MSYLIFTQCKEIDPGDWDSFVKGHPSGNVFQSYEQYLLIKEVKNIDPVAVAVYNQEHKIKGILLGMIIREIGGPLGFFTARTVIFGGPLVDQEAEDKMEILDVMLKTLNKEVRNKCIFIQFRNFHEWGECKEVFGQNGYQYYDRLNYIVNTTSESLVRKRISSSKLRQVRKGLEAGARIIEPESIDQVREFYRILKWHYKHKVNKPLYDWSFFESFYHLSKKGKFGIIRLIEYQDKIIGGIFSPVFMDKVVYELYICGLDQQYKQAYPSILSTWAAIEYAYSHGIGSFDFMGVGVPNKKYGVREFKSKFGGELVNFGRFGKINNRFIYLLTEIGYNIMALLKRI
ncbi:MAG: peptidoglycan bridge formation glycyltransferase FemA/FemB family protein [Bacteroidales bacterium]|nr:peptidoglycan bridge formation glycyltransferase FemA/FemB family protein [Bacteroidales bacterium]